MKRFLFQLSLAFLVLTGCSKSEAVDVNNPNSPDPDSGIPDNVERIDYDLETIGNSGVTGTASFIPNADGSTTVFIQLDNASQGVHPATINYGSMEDGGSLAITLTECECTISETLVTQFDDGTQVTFIDLVGFDGHLNIYESPTDGTLIAQANIGSNGF